MKTRVTWITDVHLDFLQAEQIDSFCGQIAREQSDVVLIGGDIGQAGNIVEYLEYVEAKLSLPIYFVLGNHDYYRGSIAQVRERVTALSRNNQNLNWLPASGVVELTPNTALVGHDGWGDGRLGDYAGSSVMLNDFRLIGDLAGLDAVSRGEKLGLLGDEAAAYLYTVTSEALTRYRRVIVLTHVPPFKRACLYKGQIGGDEWLPHFTCKAVGDVLSGLMTKWSDKALTVYCGHTHHAGRIDILPNLRVVVGGAEYGAPEIQSTYEVA